MSDLNLNEIYKNFQCGKIDKSTAFNDLRSIIENVQSTEDLLTYSLIIY